MRWIEKLSRAQRVVVIVALGVAFLAVGSFVLSLGQPVFALGWTGYAPLSALNGLPGWLRLIVWLALTCLWAVVSIRLLRPSDREDSDRLPE
jgi:membrane protein implicated in regulation of membrane protease activity